MISYIENVLNVSTKERLTSLSRNIPQVLFIEGGSVEDRIYTSLYTVAMVQCESEKKPCLSCPSCFSILSKHRASEEYNALERNNKKDHGIYFRFADMHYFDARYGLYSNQIRLLKTELTSSPKKKHVICILELQETHSIKEISNALLKILEEPNKSLLFILTAPIRSQILPTIISRAYTITLPWVSSRIVKLPPLPLIEGFEIFLQTGKSYFAQKQTDIKTLDATQLHLFLLHCQVALCQALQSAPINSLSKILYTYPKKTLYACSETLCKYEEQLNAHVSPSLIADTLMLTLYQNLSQST